MYNRLLVLGFRRGNRLGLLGAARERAGAAPRQGRALGCRAREGGDQRRDGEAGYHEKAGDQAKDGQQVRADRPDEACHADVEPIAQRAAALTEVLRLPGLLAGGVGADAERPRSKGQCEEGDDHHRADPDVAPDRHYRLEDHQDSAGGQGDRNEIGRLAERPFKAGHQLLAADPRIPGRVERERDEDGQGDEGETEKVALALVEFGGRGPRGALRRCLGLAARLPGGLTSSL